MTWKARALGCAAFLASCVGCGAAEPAAEQPTAVEEAPEPPALAWLEALGRGDRARVDLARGVVFVTYASDASGEDPDADEDGTIRTARRLCGPELDAALTQLAADITRRVEDDVFGPMMACADATCSFPAMGEYDTTGDLGFEGGVLQTVVRIEGGPVGEEFRAEGARWADDATARLAGGRCE
ncbi:MAG: hypothetical protein H6719_22165 [Sandaracinaceae bacterium]|nr:hypothetical protein [Sandaracinaceae bacterium]